MTWYYTRNGQQFGPCGEEEMQRLVGQGAIAATDMVWKAGMEGWAPASSLFPPPVPAGGPPPLPPPPASPQPYVHPAYTAPKQRVAYVLLGLFLGLLGIHNFYAGYVGRAVAQLLITVLIGWLVVPLVAVAIWALVEIIVVSHDAKGRPFA